MRGITMKGLIAVTMVGIFATSTLFANSHPDELYLRNSAGGVIALTHEPCSSQKHKELYPYRAYATEASGKVHEGCFTIPSISQAPKMPGMTPMPLVNYIDIESDIPLVWPAEWFDEFDETI
jgi:hypothetical protein